MNYKKYYEELNILRAIIIIWVIIGHSVNATPLPSVLGFLHSYAYSFHMDAFFLLSGLLFYSSQKLIGIKEKYFILEQKAKKLLVPYLFLTIVSLGLKTLFAVYANNQIDWNTLVKDIILGVNNPNGGLWFLHTLFVFCSLAIFLNVLPLNLTVGVMAILKIYSINSGVSIPVINHICTYGIFYFCGIKMSELYEIIARKIPSDYLIAIVPMIISIMLTYLGVYFVDNPWLNLFIAAFNIITWYLIAISITRLTETLKLYLNVIGNYGMDIYMIGYYVQITIRVVMGSMIGVPYVIYSVLMCLLGLLIPIVMSKYVIRRIPVFSILVLGDFR